MKLFPGSITDVLGIKVGHDQDLSALTGCSVVLCESGAIAGVDQRGGAPGTRETDLLRPMHLVEKVHAIVLAGGSAFGLEAATGVMRYLEERKIGFDVRVAHVPIVPAAILFDLEVGDSTVRPDAAMGYRACQNAASPMVSQGNIGAGTGAAVGKMFGVKRAMKGGIGTASMDLGGGVIIGSLVAVNAYGDILDPTSNRLIAGLLDQNSALADTMAIMKTFMGRRILQFSSHHNTVIGVVATNAKLSKEAVNKVAQTAHNGLAQTIRPAHTMFDGDTIFALSTNQRRTDVNIVAAYAPEVVARAILNAIIAAEPAGGLPTARSLGFID
ncbi:MAG TPA: peptidase S58 [Anaerolineaceae bacterium]|nr:MAG: peptidase S58 [Chloroflexi bacterium GWB2_54_36]HAL17733.1 peptidase S58 [Anaerolineaceae bacterium]